MRYVILAISMSLMTACASETTAPETKKEPTEAVPAAAKAPADDKAGCTYTVSDAKPGWTAYKFTEKAPVGGTFNTFKMSEGTAAPTLTGALKGLTMEIDGASIESGNPGRNATVATQYFGKFAEKAQLKGAVVSASGDAEKGTVVINLGMNGVSKDVEFTYAVSAEGALKAKATMEMMDFSLKAAFDSIHETCKALHTGKDGLAKTWTDVALTVDAKVTKSCS